VDGTIERLALGDVQRLLIGKLSRGYRQRVAIAQALLGSPDVLILDEPTNGLDRQIIEMRAHIRALAGERTVVVTSHILSEIERVADRVAIVLAGRLLGVHALRSAGCSSPSRTFPGTRAPDALWRLYRSASGPSLKSDGTNVCGSAGSVRSACCLGVSGTSGGGRTRARDHAIWETQYL